MKIMLAFAHEKFMFLNGLNEEDPTAIMNINDGKIRVKITSVKKLVELSRYFKKRR